MPTAYIYVARLDIDNPTPQFIRVSMTYGYKSFDLSSAIVRELSHPMPELAGHLGTYRTQDKLTEIISDPDVHGLTEMLKDKFCIAISTISEETAKESIDRLIAIAKPKLCFAYCTYSDTIRLQPENHVIAIKLVSEWVCNPDQSVPVSLRLKVFEAITCNSDLRWGTGDKLAKALNDLIF